MASIFRTGQRLWLFVRGTRVAVRVQSHDRDTITLSVGPSLVVQRGVVVPIGCPVPQGFMLYWMQVLSEPNALGRHVVLRRNPNAGSNFNRRGWRVKVSMPAKMKRAGAPHFIEGHAVNLSMEGLFLESAANVAPGDLVDLRMSFPEARPCQLVARVCRLVPGVQAPAPGWSDGQPISTVGLSFVEIPPETRSVLTLFMWRAIRESRGASIVACHD